MLLQLLFRPLTCELGIIMAFPQVRFRFILARHLLQPKFTAFAPRHNTLRSGRAGRKFRQAKGGLFLTPPQKRLNSLVGDDR